MPPLTEFGTYMRLRGLSPVTIESRLEILRRLQVWLDAPLVDATPARLAGWQRQFTRLAPASVDIYTRNVQSFYRWAAATGLIDADPAVNLPRPRISPGRPHPTSIDDLRTIFACTTGTLRTVFALATFAGLRCGEICRLQRPDVDFVTGTARLDGKGGKERTVPLVAPLVDELARSMPRHGYVVLHHGRPFLPDRLSGCCQRHLRGLGVASTLHSMRHAFATNAYRATGDLLLVADLLGHKSVQTTQIYAAPDMDRAHAKLQAISDMAANMLAPPRRLRAV